MATLEQILDNREERVRHQEELLDLFESTLISFTMNMPGSEKNSPLIEDGFNKGLFLISTMLDFYGIDTINFEEVRAVTGPEGFFSVDGDAVTVKKLMSAIETAFPVGRLFDIDVFHKTGEKVSRSDIGRGPRKCLICDRDARECARTHAHTYEKLVATATGLLEEAVSDDRSAEIADLAILSLILEASTTCKPGLVDLRNNGSHKDMDFFLLCESAASLYEYFKACAATRDFGDLRELGIKAEETMLKATGGVNTHKGIVFIFALLLSAIGETEGDDIHDSSLILDRAGEKVKGITAADFKNVTLENAKTAGERFYAEFGITGIRGQAEMKFPGVRSLAIPVISTLLKEGYSLNDAGRIALLHIIAGTDDTNMIKRGGMETAKKARDRILRLLCDNNMPTDEELNELDDEFISLNLSPGGSADLLSAAYLLCLCDNFLS
ncbi:MAG: citrate lyase holo-[acyl-carrier protein] synthase [Eubacteriales bacterium]|nr:citrate lyase holo-[acyl-carrier protein] synthase [Eubacteriales bacterium]